MRTRYIFFVLASIFSVACNSTLENPDLVPDSEKLQIITGKMELLSGGKDSTLVLARIPNDAGPISISFATTAGSFIYSAAKADKAFADSVSGNYRFASTIVKSDTTHGNVYITVTSATVQKRLTIKFK